MRSAARRQQTQPGALDLHLHPKQWGAFLSRATEILYGGAAGGGKSFLMRVAAIVWCSAIPGLQVYLFRRIRDDLIKNHMEGPKGFRALLAPWESVGWARIVDDEIRFWNGSKIYLCHCKDEKDIYKYQGAEIHVLLIDELTHFTETMYRFLRNRVRMVGIVLPAEHQGRFPRILCGANPGNIGHLWVKNTFILGSEPFKIRLMPPAEGGMSRQFISARLDDNPSMAEDDPGYENRLEGLGSQALVKAMRWGDWDVVEGAFFDCWSHEKHVLAPFTLPDDWLRFRSGDWGSASPTSIGWWAVVQDDFDLRCDGSSVSKRSLRGVSTGSNSNVVLPRGAIIRYREDYIASAPNKGLKLTAEQVADRIIERERGDPKLSYAVLDPSAFKQDGGPSIAERINGKLVKARMAAWREADNARVTRVQGGNKSGPMGGWDQMRARMIGTGTATDPEPMLFVFSTCLDFIRTVPVLQHDTERPEDVNTHSDDHCFAGETLVETSNGGIPIEVLARRNDCGVVHSIWHRELYESARLTRRDAEVVRLTFDNGRQVICTPDHRFLVNIDKTRYVFARDLAGASVECSRSLSAERSKNSMASAITFAGNTFSATERAFILGCGSITTDLYRQAITFIMRTMIARTMIPTTSNALLSRITLVDDMARRVGTEDRKALRRLARQLPIGTAPQRDEHGTWSISQSISSRSWRSAFLQSVNNAARDTWSALRRSLMVGSAARTAKPARCVAVERLSEKRDVYCLTVPANAHFAIEGGILVRNCADEARYACLSRPYTRTPIMPEPPRDGYRPPSEMIPSDSFKTM